MPGCVTAAGSAACACKSQLASLLACQMPLKLGLPPMLAGRAPWVCPDAWVRDRETTATVIIERKNRSRMMVSSCLPSMLLLQQVLQDLTKDRAETIHFRDWRPI